MYTDERPALITCVSILKANLTKPLYIKKHSNSSATNYAWTTLLEGMSANAHAIAYVCKWPSIAVTVRQY